MSCNVSAALRLELQPSRQRQTWRWLMHLAVSTALPMLHSPWLMAAVAALICLSLYHSRIDQRITLLLHSDGLWTCFENGDECAVTLADVPFVQPWLVILPLRVAARRRVKYIAIFPDMLASHTHRRLRVRLRSRLSEVAEAGDQ